MTAATRKTTQTLRYEMGERNQEQTYINKALQKATHIVHLLQKDGFTVEKVLVEHGRPKIRISFHPRVKQFGEPSIASKGNNGRYYETAMVEFEGCQLSWTVR